MRALAITLGLALAVTAVTACTVESEEQINTIAPIMKEEEGATVTVQSGFNPSMVKLSGNVQGSAPYKGTLRHKGWRASDLSLPTPVKGHDPEVIAPAEVEL